MRRGPRRLRWRSCRRSSSAPILASAAERTGLHLVTDKINQAQQEPLRHLRASSLSFSSTNMNIMISQFKKTNVTQQAGLRDNRTTRRESVWACVGLARAGAVYPSRCSRSEGEQAGCRRRSKQASRGCAKHRQGNGARGRQQLHGRAAHALCTAHPAHPRSSGRGRDRGHVAPARA